MCLGIVPVRLREAMAAWLRSCDRKPFRDMKARPHWMQGKPSASSVPLLRSTESEVPERDGSGLIFNVIVSTCVTFQRDNSCMVKSSGSSGLSD